MNRCFESLGADPMFTTTVCSTVQGWSARKLPPSNAEVAARSAAVAGERMKFIHQMLDCFGPEHNVLGRYELLGRQERRTGGAVPHPLFMFYCYMLVGSDCWPFYLGTRQVLLTDPTNHRHISSVELQYGVCVEGAQLCFKPYRQGKAPGKCFTVQDSQ